MMILVKKRFRVIYHPWSFPRVAYIFLVYTSLQACVYTKQLQATGAIANVIIKITISSIAIGLKNSFFSTNSLNCQVVIGQFVIGQFNRPITFKVVV